MSADPANDFAALFEPLLLNTFEAAIAAALVDVIFLCVFVCDNADPAAVFAVFEDLGLRRTLLAAEAAFLDVASVFFFIILFYLYLLSNFGSYINRGGIVEDEECHYS